MKIGKRSLFFILHHTFFLFFLIPAITTGQVTISGKVIYQKDAKAAVSANIAFLHEKSGTFTNKDGNFSITIKNIKSNEKLLISSVGYESLSIPLAEALLRKEFVLREQIKNLETVTVFNTHSVLGSTVESVGYFRSWNPKHTGGEIGRIFTLPYKKYKIDRVRFKVANFCDTCLLRVHIRNIINGAPGDEVLKDSISITINKLMLNGKIPEFDLSPYDLTFTDKELYVSIEVLNCSVNPKEFCGFSFAGTEKGEYIYKTTAESAWESTDDYTVYLKLFLRY